MTVRSDGFSNNFIFTCNRLGKTQYAVTNAPVPEVISNPVPVPAGMHTINTPSEQVTYGSLNIQFIVDENLDNYKEIFDWMHSFRTPNQPKPTNIYADHTSDGSIILLSSAKNPLNVIKFTGLFPTNLGQLDFAFNQGVRVLTCNAIFDFTEMHFGE